MKKVESLQAYRDVAAVLVVLYHVTANLQDTYHLPFLHGYFAFGFTGIDAGGAAVYTVVERPLLDYLRRRMASR